MTKSITSLEPSELLNFNPLIAFFDIDGTVLKADHSISEAVAASIAKLRRRGVKVCLATGRPLFGAGKIIEKLHIDQPSVFSSGAVCINPLDQSILFQHCLEPALAKDVILRLREANIYFELYSSRHYFIEHRNELTDLHKSYLLEEPLLIDDAFSLLEREQIDKIVAIGNRAEHELLLRAIAADFPQLSFGLGRGSAHPNITFLNIVSPKASRENAFAALINYYQVKAENVLAFGDADADIPFLSLSGWGIALGNAADNVKAAARFTTKTVEEDGVAHALKCLGF